MLSKEDNEFACRVGPGTPMGELFRRFWLPAMLPDEILHADCPPVRLRLLGEDLVAFRDSNNKIGVVEAHCPHRGASLYFGRNEECGIRCVYHGWKIRCRRQLRRHAVRTRRKQLQRQDSHHVLPDGRPRRPDMGLHGA